MATLRGSEGHLPVHEPPNEVPRTSNARPTRSRLLTAMPNLLDRSVPESSAPYRSVCVCIVAAGKRSPSRRRMCPGRSATGRSRRAISGHAAPSAL